MKNVLGSKRKRKDDDGTRQRQGGLYPAGRSPRLSRPLPQLTATEKLALRALTLTATELADGQGWIVEGQHSHRVSLDGQCDCIAFGVAPADTAAQLRCKHIFKIAVQCNDSRALGIVRDLASRLCVDYKLTRRAS